jgi:FKBP-type peptidyl-prolyl cis-trans isomerase
MIKINKKYLKKIIKEEARRIAENLPWSEESVASEIERAKELDSDDHQYPQDKLSTAIKDVIDLVAEYEEEYSEDANAAMMELHAELDKKFGTEFLRFNVHPNQIKRSDDREAKQQNIKSMERSQLGFDETIKRWGKIIKE